MKRDMDLIRALLLKLESLPLELGDVVTLSPDGGELAIDGYTPEQIEYHLDLMRSAKLIECPGSQPMLGIKFSGLTWAGHDFLDAVRDPEIWRKTKKGAEAAGGFSLELLKGLATGFVKTKIEEHTGVKL